MHENALSDTMIAMHQSNGSIIVSYNALSCIVSIYMYICLYENIISSNVFTGISIGVALLSNAKSAMCNAKLCNVDSANLYAKECSNCVTHSLGREWYYNNTLPLLLTGLYT